ncbi:hypothetical protein SLA2020_500710 [Shorea laevis]
MDTQKQRREQAEKGRQQTEGNKEERGVCFESRTKTTVIDPLAKLVISESIINDGSKDDKANAGRGAAQKPDDVLAFSRAVHKIDSSLE